MMLRNPVLFALLLCVGCASKAPLNVWRQKLETYVSEEGNGDLNVLRNIEPSTAPKSFNIIGAAKAGMHFVSPKRTDVNGVLLALPSIDSRHWYIFLVGVVEYSGRFSYLPLDHSIVRDVRVVALSQQQGKLQWLIGQQDKAAVTQYIQAQRSAQRGKQATVFPAQADSFDFKVSGGVVTITDRRSGAHWQLLLPQAKEPAQTASSDLPSGKFSRRQSISTFHPA